MTNAGDRDKCQGIAPGVLDSPVPAPTHSQTEQTATTRRLADDELRARVARLRDWQRRFREAVRIEERLELLIDFGLTDQDIAKAVPNAGDRSIRRWRTEGPPRTRVPERWDPIDDLCTVIRYLLSDGSYDEEGVVAWLRSRQPELGNQRPLDVLGNEDFDAVIAAAAQTLVSVMVEDHEQITLPRRPVATRLSARHRVS